MNIFKALWTRYKQYQKKQLAADARLYRCTALIAYARGDHDNYQKFAKLYESTQALLESEAYHATT